MTQAYTNRFTEVERLGGVLYPGNYVPGDYYTAFTHMGNSQRAVFIVLVGDMGAGGTVNSYILESSDGTLATAQYIAAKAAGVAQVLGGGDDALAIELRTEELDIRDGFCWVAGYVNVTGKATDLSGTLLLGCSNQVPVPTPVWDAIVD